MPLNRRLEPNAQIFDYKCTEFVDELMYGRLRKEPLPVMDDFRRWYEESHQFVANR